MSHRTINISVDGPLASVSLDDARHITDPLHDAIRGVSSDFDPQAPAVDPSSVCMTDEQFHFPSVFVDRILHSLRRQGRQVVVSRMRYEGSTRFDPDLDVALRRVALEAVGHLRLLFRLDSTSTISKRDVVRAISSTHAGRIKDVKFPRFRAAFPARAGQCLVVENLEPLQSMALVWAMLAGRLHGKRLYAVTELSPSSAREAVELYSLFGPAVRLAGPPARASCPVEFVTNPAPGQIPSHAFAISVACMAGRNAAVGTGVDSQSDMPEDRLSRSPQLGDDPPVWIVVDHDSDAWHLAQLLNARNRPRSIRAICHRQLATIRLAGSVVVLAHRWSFSALDRLDWPMRPHDPPRKILAITHDQLNASVARAIASGV